MVQTCAKCYNACSREQQAAYIAEHGLKLLLALVLVQLKLALAQHHFENLKTQHHKPTKHCKQSSLHRIQIAQIERLKHLAALGALAVDHIRENVAHLQHFVEIGLDTRPPRTQFVLVARNLQAYYKAATACTARGGWDLVLLPLGAVAHHCDVGQEFLANRLFNSTAICHGRDALRTPRRGVVSRGAEAGGSA